MPEISSESSDSGSESLPSDFDSSSDEESEPQEPGVQPGENPEDDDEDEVIKAIIREQNKKRDHPPDLKFEEHITDISFHPSKNIIMAADMMGNVAVCNYSNDESSIVDTWELHCDSCRSIEFSRDGDLLFSCGLDRVVMVSDVNTGKLKRYFENAHETPINCIHIIDENIFATGDDEGRVRLWDLRRNLLEPIYQTKKHEDYISAMLTDNNKSYLLCASGDGTISSIDLKKRQFFVRSDNYDEEFTGLGLFRTETKVLASTTKGKLYLFNWQEFGYHSDEFPGLKLAINDIIPITENIVVTANENGILRAIHLFPHRHLGVVGQHTMSVESLDICNNGEIIASSSHNNDIKFWNIKYFEEFDVLGAHEKKNKEMIKNNLPSSKETNRKDFFSELA